MSFPDKNILDIFLSNNFDDFFSALSDFLISEGIDRFTVGRIENRKPVNVFSHNYNIDIPFDLSDMGLREGNRIAVDKELAFFDDKYVITLAVLIRHKKTDIAFIFTHSPVNEEMIGKMSYLNDYFGKTAYELLLKEKRTDIYVEYQKKIEFIMQSSSIFKNLEYESVINSSLYSFMGIFSAEAACAFHGEEFYNIGVNNYDVKQKVFIGSETLYNYLKSVSGKVFLEGNIQSDSFSIRNILVIKNELAGIFLIFFNVSEYFKGEEEFINLALSIFNIAVENSQNHQRTLKHKLEEAEMAKTVEILGKFVPQEMSGGDYPQIYGVSYPAKKAGGDFISIYDSGGKMFFILADVCGKGYSAAIITVALSVISEMYKSGLIKSPAAEIVEMVNSFFLSRNLDDRFVTGFVGVYDKTKKVLDYLSLGHEPAILLKNDVAEFLHSQYMPIGIMHENYDMSSVKVEEGTSLLVYSDGLTEYTDFDGIKAKLVNYTPYDPEYIVKSLYNDIVDKTTEQKDDFTCIMIKF